VDRSLLLRATFLAIAFVAPLTGVAGLLLGQQSAKMAVTAREREGLGFTTRTIEAVRALRALRDRVARGGASDGTERRVAAAALASLDGYGTADGRSLEVAQRLTLLDAEWSRANREPQSAGRIAQVLATAVSLFELTRARSTLGSDADAPTANLIDAFGTQLPAVNERTDRAALILTATASREGSPFARRIASAIALGQARRAYQIALADVANARRALEEPDRMEQAVNAVGTHLAALIALASRDAATLQDPARDATAFLAAGNAVLDAAYGADGLLAREIDRRLTQREAAERFAIVLLRGGFALAIVLGSLIALVLARAIRDRDRRDLDRARGEAQRLAAELGRQKELEALAVTEAHFRAVFERSSIGVAILDHHGQLLRTNDALRDMLPDVGARLIGAGHPDFQRLVTGEIESFVTEIQTRSSTHSTMWLEATLSLVRDDAGEPRFAISMVKDVTERKRIDDRLRHEATHDALSRLPNRAYFFDRVHATFFGGTFPSGEHAVLFVDLDEFKFVNDSLGHAVGDRVIIASGERLRALAGPHDCVARFGGDEFAVLLGARSSRADIERLVERLERALAEPLMLDGQEIFVTASIGVANVHPGYTSVEDIMRDADTAMYHAKANGRARSATFVKSMHDQASRRLEIATQMRRALDREQLYLVYQPVVSLTTGKIRSCEVLMRWEHPELGNIPPNEFIPIAEEIGMIVPIGRYALDRACRQLAEWKRSFPNFSMPRISVNASVREIVQGDYVDVIEQTVAKYGLRPGELLLEVTETAILSSGKYSFGTLERIKAAGVGLAIDDFGTGYSSLRYLQQFPFDELKIDRSFVGGADGRLASEPIVSMILTLARTVGVSVVAEGVETAAQAARLRTLGCAYAQGYLYGRPSRADDLVDMLRHEAVNFAS